MIDRRHAVRLALAALAAATLPRAARAEASYERLYPLLIDLPGWTGAKPDGMAMQMGGMNMMTATRKYTRAGATLDVGILTGAPAQAGLAMIQGGMKFETSEARMSVDTVDGLKVARTYTVKGRSGALFIGLTDSALFSFAFTGVAEDEALALAKRFDWKAMQAALPK
jgi:hypothetical protein